MQHFHEVKKKSFFLKRKMGNPHYQTEEHLEGDRAMANLFLRLLLDTYRTAETCRRCHGAAV